MMTDYFGARLTIIVGGLVTTLGFVLTFFSTSFIFTCITFGFIAGTGFGIVYVPCLATVGIYFEKYRTIAYGLLTMGTGFGWLILSPAVEYICSEYGWRAAMIFIAGFALQLVLIGAVTRPLNRDANNKNVCNTTETIDTSENQQESALTFKQQHDEDVNAAIDQTVNINLHTSKKSVKQNVGSNDKDSVVNSVNGKLLFDSVDKQHDQNNQLQSDCRDVQKSNYPSEIDIYSKYKPLLKSTFIIFLVNILCLYASQAMYYIHFPAFAKSKGTSSSELSIIFSCMGAATITSRFTTGLVASREKINICLLYIVTCVLTGIVLICGPAMGVTYGGQIAFGVCFALFTNVSIPLAVPILIQLLGVELVNMSTGIHIFMGGFGFMFAPPFAGFLFDISGNYQTTFYTAGAIMIFGGIVMIPLLCQKQHKEITSDKALD